MANIERIFETDRYIVDFASLSSAPRFLTVTFSEFGSRRVDGLGFAGSFLWNEGIAICAVKSKRDWWYQDFPEEAIEAINKRISSLLHSIRWVSTYGSSMGAYGAIALAKSLNADSCLAISPQFDIRGDFDSRWSDHAEAISDFQCAAAEGISASCYYIIVFDPCNLDKAHFDEYAKIIPAKRLIGLPIPYSGHPSGPFLRDTETLKPLAILALTSPDKLLESLSELGKVMKRNRMRSRDYVKTLARAAIDRNKLRFATNFLCAAAGRSLFNLDAHVLLSESLQKAGKIERAILHASHVCACTPEDPASYARLALLLREAHRPSLALFHIDRAVALQPGNDKFKSIRSAILESIRSPEA